MSVNSGTTRSSLSLSSFAHCLKFAIVSSRAVCNEVNLLNSPHNGVPDADAVVSVLARSFLLGTASLVPGVC